MLVKLWKHVEQRSKWSWAGLSASWKSEYSFRGWVWANLVSAGLALILPLGGAERGMILVLGLLVIAAELINTAIEETVDYISTDLHPSAGRAKDAGSAAVMVTAIATGVAWVVALVGMLG